MDGALPATVVRTLFTADVVVTGAGTIGNAVLVENGRVVTIGMASDLRSRSVTEDSYAGATIIPGLRDAHIHAVPYAASLHGCSLKSATSIEELKHRLSSYSRTLPDHEPVVATRFDDEALVEHRLPTRMDLDDAIPDRPVVIYRYCGHIAVANTAALAQSDITRDTPDPEGGTIDRGPDGQPTGVLRETAAGLVGESLAHSSTLSDSQLLAALHGLAGLGVTSIGAMVGYGERPFEQFEVELDQWCRIAPELPIRVKAILITGSPKQLESAVSRIEGAGRRLTWLGVKRFADGSLGGHTAALSEPFSDVDTTGTLRLGPLDTEVAARAIELGGMAAIHAIGDRAVDKVLDMFEVLIARGADPRDLRMEHVSVIRPDQIQRFAVMGVTASVQPAFLASEATWVESRVGHDRREWLYPFRSLLDAGIPLAGSSDCPVEPPHPLWGMAAAMDRFGIGPDQQLTGAEALAMFTSGAARALREAEPLSEGSRADFVVLDTNPVSAGASQVRDATVLDTFIDGKEVLVDRDQPVWLG